MLTPYPRDFVGPWGHPAQASGVNRNRGASRNGEDLPIAPAGAPYALHPVADAS